MSNSKKEQAKREKAAVMLGFATIQLIERAIMGTPRPNDPPVAVFAKWITEARDAVREKRLRKTNAEKPSCN